jgi:hypothetical protein
MFNTIEDFFQQIGYPSDEWKLFPQTWKVVDK